MWNYKHFNKKRVSLRPKARQSILKHDNKPKQLSRRGNVGKSDFIKTSNTYSVEYPLKRMDIQAANLGSISANHTSDKWLISTICK
jgi:hypothetical protein